MLSATPTATEKPQNGIQGLRHWRHDLLAGLQVALVSLPLSLGIAIASGAPPVTGLISAIIAGLVLPFVGGSYVTISGPAAGLAPVLLTGMLTLGAGDLSAGYPLLLVAIFLTGMVQIILSVFKAGEFSRILPIAVVEGMLAAIGTMIIIKQIPLLVGDVVAPAKTIIAALASLPHHLLNLDPSVTVIGVISLALIFVLKSSKNYWFTLVPAPIVVALAGITLGYLLQLDQKYLIQLPENILQEGFTLPHFDMVWENRDLWLSILVVIVTLTLVDGIESLASIAAIDKIDPFQRRSDPNVTLRAMGIANMASSIAGGLTIIPGGIKSRANVDAGGRTLWANGYNALFLMLFLWLGRDLINRLPLTTLAAILIYVGWRLCEPRVFKKTLGIGREQLFLFVTTLISILLTDLLTGIIIGVLSKIALVLYLLTPSLCQVFTQQRAPGQIPRFMWESFNALFKSPIIKTTMVEGAEGNHYRFYLSSLFCFNLLRLEKALNQVPQRAPLTLTFADSARMIDHTSMEYLFHVKEQSLHDGRRYEIEGMEKFYAFSNHSLAARLHDPRLVKEQVRMSERQLRMLEVAERYKLQFSPNIVSSLNENNFLYLSRGSNKEERNTMSGLCRGWEMRLFDYNYTVPPYYFAEDWHTAIILKAPYGMEIPDFILEPEHYLDKYRSERSDINFTQYPVFSRRYFLYGRDEAAIRAFFTAPVIAFFDEHPKFYLEARAGCVLAFRSNQDLEDPAAIHVLFGIADLLRENCASV